MAEFAAPAPIRRFTHARNSSESSQWSVCSELHHIISDFPSPEVSITQSPTSRKPRSQEEMIEYLSPRIRAEGIVKLKEGKRMARPAKKREVVETIVAGETVNVRFAYDDTSMVVRHGAPDHELLLMTKLEFEKNYDMQSGEDIRDGGEMDDELSREGFMYYHRTGAVVLVQMTEADVLFCSHGYNVGFSLEAHFPIAGNHFALTRDVSELSGVSDVYNCFHAEAIYKLSQEEITPIRTQQEMFEKFAPIMNEHGIKKARTGERMARPAKQGEQVTTKVRGMTVSSRSAPDDNHMIVVHMTGRDTVVFLMSKVDFFKKYDISHTEVPESLALYRQKGYRMYTRKGDTLLYSLTEADIADFAPKGFWVNWSNRPLIPRAGDHLAMPVPINADEPDVYICHHARAFYELPDEEEAEELTSARDLQEKRRRRHERREKKQPTIRLEREKSRLAKEIEQTVTRQLKEEGKKEIEQGITRQLEEKAKKEEDNEKVKKIKRALSVIFSVSILSILPFSSELVIIALGSLVYGGWVSENAEKIASMVVPICGMISVVDWCDDSWDLEDDVGDYLNMSYGRLAESLYDNVQWLATRQS